MTTVAEKKAFVGGKWQTEVDLVDFITKLNCKNRTEAVKKSTEEGWL